MSTNYVDDKVSDAVLRRPRETLFASDAHFGVRVAQRRRVGTRKSADFSLAQTYSRRARWGSVLRVLQIRCERAVMAGW